jgi:hypothetical protein
VRHPGEGIALRRKKLAFFRSNDSYVAPVS